MGFPEPNYVGHCAFRVLAYFPEGQPFEPKVNYVYGKGVCTGYVPVSETKVYWLSASIARHQQIGGRNERPCAHDTPGPKITDPSILRQQAEELVRNWPTT
ncbi:hypothetical protein RND71_024872 [Anisodus tanguticus]|uniref:Uncharacterized protein n=1 Tax=Anisodus tanguticus TaxID=243964 RepID=A0AAE1V9W1_9SOLA|nr:hypothetical protein RND71_024872 [Anisodus tanguticus]